MIISPSYLELQKELHARPEGYGDKGDKWAPAVADLVTRFAAQSVLDFGCGRGTLAQALRPLVADSVRISEYDPSIPGKDEWPGSADLVVATDVLEHIEPDWLLSTLRSLSYLARRATFAVVSTRPAQKILADGRNAHLIIESDEWWWMTLASVGWFVEPGPKSPHPKPSRELSVVLS